MSLRGLEPDPVNAIWAFPLWEEATRGNIFLDQEPSKTGGPENFG